MRTRKLEHGRRLTRGGSDEKRRRSELADRRFIIARPMSVRELCPPLVVQDKLAAVQQRPPNVLQRGRFVAIG